MDYLSIFYYNLGRLVSMPEMEPEPLSTNPTLSLPNSKTSLQVEM